jgi:hypothetical protein
MNSLTITIIKTGIKKGFFHSCPEGIKLKATKIINVII